MVASTEKEERRFAFYALASAAPATGGMLSLAVAFFIAWLTTIGTDIYHSAFAPLGFGQSESSEAFKRITYFFFFALWTLFLCLWFGKAIRSRGVIKAILSDAKREHTAILFAVFSCLPLAFVPLLLTLGVEVNYYDKGRLLFFKDWIFFQLFLFAPLLTLSASVVLAASWWMALNEGSGAKFAETTAAILFITTACLISVRIGLFPPPDGFVTDFDTHHKSAVLEPLARYYVTGQETYSQYGGYYVFGGTFARLASTLGVEPFTAVQLFFALALGAAFGAFGLSLRLASGSWLPAFAALAAALSFAAIPYRTMLYLQVEPVRTLFPALGMLSIVLAAPLLAAGRTLIMIPLFMIAFAAIKWNPETGIATTIALLFTTFFLNSPRTLKDASRLVAKAATGFILGWLLAYVLSLLAMPLWQALPREIATSVSSPDDPISPLFFLAVFLRGIFDSPAPVLHAWMAMGLGAIWFVSFTTTRLSLRSPADISPNDARLFGLLLFCGFLFLLTLIYYVHLSVPATLTALSYPFFAASALAAHSGLKRLISPGGYQWIPFTLGPIAAAFPLLFLAPLLPKNAAEGGLPPRLVTLRDVTAAREVCSIADRYAKGGGILYLGQNDWWYELVCGRVFNHGLVPQALLLSNDLNEAWKQRLSQVSVVFHEADMVQPGTRDYGGYGMRMVEYYEILNKDFLNRITIKDWNGKRLTMFVRSKTKPDRPNLQQDSAQNPPTL